MLTFFAPALIFLLQEESRGGLMVHTIKNPDLSRFLMIGALLFVIGVGGVLTRRNIIVSFR